jgi:hypothetical protein
MFNLPFSVEFSQNGQCRVMAKGINYVIQQIKISLQKYDLQSFSDKIKDFAKSKYNIENMSLKNLNVSMVRK